MSKTTVLLIDDHAILRGGYQHMLIAAGFDVIGQASDAEEGYQQYLQLMPDISVIDINMPGVGGIECIRRIHNRNPKAVILVCSMYDDSTVATRALEVGALGYVTKSSPPEVFIEAVKTVENKRNYLSPEIARTIAMDKLIKPAQKIDSLSHREYAIFQMIVVGKSISDMATILSLAPKTISNYKNSMMRKLDANGIAEVILIAQKYGLIESKTY